MFYAFKFHLIWQWCIRVSFNNFNMSYHHPCMRIASMPCVDCYFSFYSICFFAIDRARARDDEDQQRRRSIFVHQRTSQARDPRRSILVCQGQRQALAWFIYDFEMLLLLVPTYCMRFNCLLSIGRVILSIACSILVASNPWSTAPSIPRSGMCASLEPLSLYA